MDRRRFIAGAVAVVAAPLVAEAQQAGKVWRIGLLETSSPSPARVQLRETFRQRLRELGYLEGQNIAFESRIAEGKTDRLPGLAVREERRSAVVCSGRMQTRRVIQHPLEFPPRSSAGKSHVRTHRCRSASGFEGSK